MYLCDRCPHSSVLNRHWLWHCNSSPKGKHRSLLYTELVATCAAGMERTGVYVSLLRCHIKLDKFRNDEARCSLLRNSGIFGIPDGIFCNTFNDRWGSKWAAFTPKWFLKSVRLRFWQQLTTSLSGWHSESSVEAVPRNKWRGYTLMSFWERHKSAYSRTNSCLWTSYKEPQGNIGGL